jgi:uncharacterized protein YbcC (UPF0753/DUF2309 family)
MKTATNVSGADVPKPERLRQVLEHVAHLLPAQGPIDVFIHHNTLHAFEEEHFHDAVAHAREVFDAEPYLSEQQYQKHFALGRITEEDLESCLDEQRGVDGTLGPFRLRQLDRFAMLHSIPREDAAGLQWQLQERRRDRRFRDDVPQDLRIRVVSRSEIVDRFGSGANAEESAVLALWKECCAVPLAASLSHDAPARPRNGNKSFRELLLDRTGADTHDWVHPTLIRFCAAFLDAGVAYWPLPQREQGFYRAWCGLIAASNTPVGWKLGLRDEVLGELAQGADATDSLLRSLEAAGIEEAGWEAYLTQTLRYLPGWGGMMHWFDAHAEHSTQASVGNRLTEFLAVRMIYDRYAALHVAETMLGYDGPLNGLRESLRFHPHCDSPELPPIDLEWRLFQIAQLAGLAACDLRQCSLEDRTAALQHLDSFSEIQRRRVWCEAYERHFRQETLHAIASNLRRVQAANGPQLVDPSLTGMRAATLRPNFQIVTCIDEREESFRRHFEEGHPDRESFGVAGFFGLAIDYHGLDDGHASALCPVVVTPQHRVHEEPVAEHRSHHDRRHRKRRVEARLRHAGRIGSQTALRGLALLPISGVAAAFHLTTEILAARSAGQLRSRIQARLFPKPITRLTAEHQGEHATCGKPVGFSVEEMTQRVATTLENIGLVQGMARLVTVLGHGSISMNNPHESAHDCGACGGGHGAANARLFAEFANRPDVRKQLRARKIEVPDDVWFIGGLHNTSSDAVTLFDTDLIPSTHTDDLGRLVAALDDARARSAQERCRRFASAPRRPSLSQALQHAEWRATTLAEPRPELGHATNASCIVGRRSLTRGLFLDRRAFLVSYDPDIDGDGSIIERILAAVGPVGAGISLEYYFSIVDNSRYGCGTKLPHNLTGLIGVMDGSASDLRTGLPKQMVDIHEPMRLLVVVEAAPDVLADVHSKQAELRRLIDNEWIQLVSIHPQTHRITRFVSGSGFEAVSLSSSCLPSTASSYEWYAGKSGFVPPALIECSKQVNHAA